MYACQGLINVRVSENLLPDLQSFFESLRVLLLCLGHIVTFFLNSLFTAVLCCLDSPECTQSLHQRDRRGLLKSASVCLPLCGTCNPLHVRGLDCLKGQSSSLIVLQLE
jgi:hypothetical protein